MLKAITLSELHFEMELLSYVSILEMVRNDICLSVYLVSGTFSSQIHALFTLY